MTNSIIQDADISAKEIISNFIKTHHNGWLKKISNDDYLRTLVYVNTSFLPDFFEKKPWWYFFLIKLIWVGN